MARNFMNFGVGNLLKMLQVCFGQKFRVHNKMLSNGLWEGLDHMIDHRLAHDFNKWLVLFVSSVSESTSKSRHGDNQMVTQSDALTFSKT